MIFTKNNLEKKLRVSQVVSNFASEIRTTVTIASEIERKNESKIK